MCYAGGRGTRSTGAARLRNQIQTPTSEYLRIHACINSLGCPGHSALLWGSASSPFLQTLGAGGSGRPFSRVRDRLAEVRATTEPVSSTGSGSWRPP